MLDKTIFKNQKLAIAGFAEAKVSKSKEIKGNQRKSKEIKGNDVFLVSTETDLISFVHGANGKHIQAYYLTRSFVAELLRLVYEDVENLIFRLFKLTAI